MPVQIGSLLQDRYRIEALLGRGGMGAVYRAHDLRLKHTVAIKQNLVEDLPEATRPGGPDASAQREQFEREAQLLASLKHPGLPKVTDYFFVPGEGQYLVMEYIEGRDFDSMIRERGSLPDDEAVGYMVDVCRVVEYLHSQQPPIIHRDIKPPNVRITDRGHVVLVDFGVAKVGTTKTTLAGARAFSPGYSPPEQLGGFRPTDERSDIYSIGATLYTLITGKPPATALERLMEKADWHPADAADGINPELRAILDRAMDMEPDKRFDSVAELRRALQPLARAQAGSTIAVPTRVRTAVPPPPPPPPMGVAAAPTIPPPPTSPMTAEERPKRRGMAPALIFGSVVVVAVVAGGLFFVMRPQPTPPVRPAGTAPARTTPSQPATGGSPGPGGAPATTVPSTGAGTDRPATQPPGGSPAQPAASLPPKPAPAAGGSSASTSSPPVQAAPAPSTHAPAQATSPPAQTPPVQTPPVQTPPVPTPPVEQPLAAPRLNAPVPGADNAMTVSWTPAHGAAFQSYELHVSTRPNFTPESSTRYRTPVMDPSTTTLSVAGLKCATTYYFKVRLTERTGRTIDSDEMSAITPACALGDTLLVSAEGGGQYLTFGDALHNIYLAHDAKTRSILLKPGTYTLPEHALIGHSMQIIGQRGGVVFQGAGGGFVIERPGVVIRGITFKTGAPALTVNAQVTAEDCEFSSNTKNALQVQGSGSLELKNCRVNGSVGKGVLVLGSGRLTATQSEFSQNESGIECRDSGRITLTECQVRDNTGSGIYLHDGGGGELVGCQIEKNKLNGVTARGASLSLRGGRIAGNGQFAIGCQGTPSTITLSGVDVSGNRLGKFEGGCPVNEGH